MKDKVLWKIRKIFCKLGICFFRKFRFGEAKKLIYWTEKWRVCPCCKKVKTNEPNIPKYIQLKRF